MTLQPFNAPGASISEYIERIAPLDQSLAME